MHKIQRHVIKTLLKKSSYELCRAGTDLSVCVCMDNHRIYQIKLLYVTTKIFMLRPGLHCARYYANKKQTASQPKNFLANSNN